jgi:hypothetical protein
MVDVKLNLPALSPGFLDICYCPSEKLVCIFFTLHMPFYILGFHICNTQGKKLCFCNVEEPFLRLVKTMLKLT